MEERKIVRWEDYKITRFLARLRNDGYISDEKAETVDREAAICLEALFLLCRNE